MPATMNLEDELDAVLSGREARDIRVDHRGFDLYPITITQEGSKIVAEGRLSTFRRISTTTNAGKPIEMHGFPKIINYSVTIRDSLIMVTGFVQDSGSTDSPSWPMGQAVGLRENSSART
jgi:hypothetical protein